MKLFSHINRLYVNVCRRGRVFVKREICREFYKEQFNNKVFRVHLTFISNNIYVDRFEVKMSVLWECISNNKEKTCVEFLLNSSPNLFCVLYYDTTFQTEFKNLKGN